MYKKWNLFIGVISILKEFISEKMPMPQYEIVDIYECDKTGFIKAVVKLSARHIIEKNISDIITDNDFLEWLDKKTIRTLTYMATMEKMKPDYSVVVQHLKDEVDDYILEIKSRTNKKVMKKTPSEISKDKLFLAKFNPIDAGRIGYLAGIKDTSLEFKMKFNQKN